MAIDPRTTSRGASLVVVRLAILGVAAAAVVVGAIASQPTETARRYVCPMHPDVVTSAPGDCPICGMALEATRSSPQPVDPHPRIPGDAQTVALSALRTSDEAIQLLRFSVAPARRNALPGEIIAPATVDSDGTIVAQLYRDELASLAPDERAELAPTTAPEAAIPIQRDPAPPTERGAIADVRFRVVPGIASPPPGQIGWVKLAYKVRAMLVVRSAAVVAAPDGPYVLVFSAQRGDLSRRRIEIGKDYAGMTAVVSGLHDKELVIMANTFSIDAERRLQAAP